MTLAFIIALTSSVLALIACLYVVFDWNWGWPRRRAEKFDLDRHGGNPVISPLPFREWESNGTFNPGAIMDDAGKIHLFYRAIGADGLSRIGHAASRSGTYFLERTTHPVYQPLSGQDTTTSAQPGMPQKYDPIVYQSGGGWGGVEDPRVTRIGDRMYMTYTAFEGWDNMRIGLTSIALEDIEKEKWNWRRPSLISPPKTRNKNWVIFPEKIRGKYAILHSVAPRVLIAYLDSLDMVPPIKSSADHHGYGHHDPVRKGQWDEVMKGAGTPPLRTDIGWLVLYHAIHQNKYMVGAMILDPEEPTRILYRAPQPILSPDMPYENDGKPGVVYATGAIIKDGQLFVYYGGGDKHSCVAQTPLQPLLDWLVKYGKI